MTRREERKAVFELLFESDFRHGENPAEILSISAENRELNIEGDSYIKKVFFGVLDNLDAIDGIISRHSKGWKTERLTGVARCILRLAVYEMFYTNLPPSIAINEAVELCKTFDDDKARIFVNGVLHAAKLEAENNSGKEAAEKTDE